MTLRGLWLAAGVGCAGPSADPSSDRPRPATTDPDTDTATEGPGPPPSLVARCVPTENALRFRCSAEIHPPQPVEIAYAPVGGEGVGRVRASRGDLSEHELVLDLMPAETAHRYVVRGTRDVALEVEGAFTTGSLPAGALLDVTLAGVSTASHLLFGSPCDGVVPVIVDGAGQVVWYELVSDSEGSRLLAASYTEDGTVLVAYMGFASEHNALVEIGLDGTRGLSVERGEDYLRSIHHDVYRRDGLTYALFNENIPLDETTVVTLDGVYVFDPSGNTVAEWHLADHWLPTLEEARASPDRSHANSVWVDAQGDMVVSFRHLSAFVKVAGGRAEGQFGEILWRLAGDPESPIGNDFALGSQVNADAAFEMQHNVHQLAPGRFALLDNGAAFDEESRVLTLVVDEDRRVATIDAAYPLGVHCDFQGAAWHTAAGSPTGTCAPMNTAYEFEAGKPEVPAFSAQVSCRDGFGTFVPRFVPLSF